MAEIAKTADQALTILLAIAERGPVSTTQLSQALGMNRTVVHRLLATLQQRAFVRRQSDGYVLGPVIVRLADAVEPLLRRVAGPIIQRLADETSETALISVPDDREVVVLEQRQGGTHMVRVEHATGSRHSLRVGATGRAILAFLPDTQVDRILRRVDDADRIRELLEDVRARGYAVSHDELQAGVYGTAAPVLDPDGMAVATVAILVPLTRVPTGNEHGEQVVRAANAVAAALFARSDRSALATI